MRRSGRVSAMVFASAVASAVLLGRCADGVGPSEPVQSAACGGFQLVVQNAGARPVAVRLNGLDAATVEAGADTTIFEYGPGGVSKMPWQVEIVDVETGSVLATRDVGWDSGEGGARIDIREGDGGQPTVGQVTSARGC